MVSSIGRNIKNGTGLLFINTDKWKRYLYGLIKDVSVDDVVTLGKIDKGLKEIKKNKAFGAGSIQM